jgi:hypothetical protein
MTTLSTQILTCIAANERRETYQLGPDSDMRTWRTENGRKLCLGEKLCAGCDEPIADGPCGCMIADEQMQEAAE